MSITITEKLAEEITVGDLIRTEDMITFQKVNDIGKSGKQIVLSLEENNIEGKEWGINSVFLATNEPLEIKEIN